MKGYCWKKKVKHTKKLKLLLTICLVFSTLAPMLPGLTFEETKAATEESKLKTIRSNIVENQLPSSTNSTETIKEKESEGEITSLVPDNVEPETKDDSPDSMTQTAESKITIADTGIILKNDGTYILTDSPEMYYENPSEFPTVEEIKGQGEYDSNTIIEFANTTIVDNLLYSEPRSDGTNNKIQQIIIADGTSSKLTIVRNSTLDVFTNMDYGIYVNGLQIGEPTELERLPVHLNVSGDKIGILTPQGTYNVTGDVATTASQAGISVIDEVTPVREDFSAIDALVENMGYDFLEVHRMKER